VLAHAMAVESKLVTAEMVEATEFPELSAQFGVSGVPHTAINDGAAEMVGSGPEEALIAEIERAIASH
jgi:hypothetical protein